MNYRGVFYRWDYKVIVHRDVYDDPELCRKETVFAHLWNGPSHPLGPKVHYDYCMNPKHVEVVEADKVIRRMTGNTWIHSGFTEDEKYIIGTWDWILPRHGFFSFKDLAAEIRKVADATNPKTAWCLQILEGVESA